VQHGLDGNFPSRIFKRHFVLARRSGDVCESATRYKPVRLDFSHQALFRCFHSDVLAMKRLHARTRARERGTRVLLRASDKVGTLVHAFVAEVLGRERIKVLNKRRNRRLRR